MPKCQTIRVKKRTVCVGDLRDQINILERIQAAPSFDGVDYEEKFEVIFSTWAGVETNRGYDSFSGAGINSTNAQDQFTHIFYIRYESDCVPTSQNWIEYNCSYYKIVNEVENLDENNEFLKIKAVKKGSPDVEANKV